MRVGSHHYLWICVVFLLCEGVGWAASGNLSHRAIRNESIATHRSKKTTPSTSTPFRGGPSAKRLTAPQSEPARRLYQRGLFFFRKGALVAAIEALRGARRLSPQSVSVRYYLARAYIQRAESLGRAGLARKERQLYQRALKEDPRLLDNPSFFSRYRELQTQGNMTRRRPPLRPRLLRKERTFNFGLGLTLGVEGLLGVQANVLLFGMFNPVVTLAPISETLDFSLRFIPFRASKWSPYIGAGLMFGTALWSNAVRAGFEGRFFHGSIGVHYLSEIGFSFNAGLSFVYSTKQTLVSSILPTCQITWFF